MNSSDLYIFRDIPEITTERLKLRMITQHDLYDVYEYSKNPETSRFLLWSAHRSVYDTKMLLNTIKKKYKQCDFFEWGIEYQGKMIGTAGFTSFQIINDSAEIGYVINPEYKGKGIATEAVKAVIKFGFENLALNRISAKYIIGNEASLRVMIKSGMKPEGVHRSMIYTKGKYVDVGVGAILKNDYFNAKY